MSCTRRVEGQGEGKQNMKQNASLFFLQLFTVDDDQNNENI